MVERYTTPGIAHSDLGLVWCCSAAMETHFMKLLMLSPCADDASREAPVAAPGQCSRLHSPSSSVRPGLVFVYGDSMAVLCAPVASGRGLESLGSSN